MANANSARLQPRVRRANAIKAIKGLHVRHARRRRRRTQIDTIPYQMGAPRVRRCRAPMRIATSNTRCRIFIRATHVPLQHVPHLLRAIAFRTEPMTGRGRALPSSARRRRRAFALRTEPMTGCALPSSARHLLRAIALRTEPMTGRAVRWSNARSSPESITLRALKSAPPRPVRTAIPQRNTMTSKR